MKVVTLSCGCSLELDNFGLYDDCAHIEFYFNFCEKHQDVKLTFGSDWLRMEASAEPLWGEGIVSEGEDAGETADTVG